MKTIAEQLGVEDFSFTIKDSRRKTIYFENSDGSWHKSKYDAQGNEIYFENSKGDWVKREYDSNRNRIYYEDSKGHIEDNRNLPEYTMEELVEKIGNFKLKIK